MEDTLPQNPLTPDAQLELTAPVEVTHQASSNTLKMAIAGLLILLPIVGVGGYYLGMQSSATNQVSNNIVKPMSASPSPSAPLTEDNQVFCTMDAKLCPDGSSVGRSGPNCEFMACPDIKIDNQNTANWTTLKQPSFELRYPSDYTLSNEPGYVRLIKTGATQTVGTEMFDGITFFITEHQTQTELETFVNQKISKTKEEGISEITQAKLAAYVGQYPAFTYQARGLGKFDYFFLQNADKKVIIEIAISVEDPQGNGYQKTVDLILNSLRLAQ